MEWVMGSIYLADPRVDRHHLISISSYHTMKIQMQSFPTFSLTCSVRGLWDLQFRVVSYLLTQSAGSCNQNSSFSCILFGYHERMQQSVDGGLSGFWLHHFTTTASKWCITKLSMGMSWCSLNYARLPSAARLTKWIYIERHKWCMPYYDVGNHVTIAKIIIWQNAVWLCKNHCCATTPPRLRHHCAEDSGAPTCDFPISQIS